VRASAACQGSAPECIGRRSPVTRPSQTKLLYAMPAIIHASDWTGGRGKKRSDDATSDGSICLAKPWSIQRIHDPPRSTVFTRIFRNNIQEHRRSKHLVWPITIWHSSGGLTGLNLNVNIVQIPRSSHSINSPFRIFLPLSLHNLCT
jgi:hypothetical protein